MDHSSESANPYASPAIPSEKQQPASSANSPDRPLVEPIRTSGALSLQDYFYGLRLARQRYWRLVFFFFLLLGLLFIHYTLFKSITLENYQVWIFFYVMLALMVGIFPIIVGWFSNWRVRERKKAGKGVFAAVESILYEDHYEVHQESMDARINWSMFCKFRYSDRLVVLFFDGNPRQFGIIPRSKFQSQHDWECFIGLLDRKMKRG
jgi:hypothetical protein